MHNLDGPRPAPRRCPRQRNRSRRTESIVRRPLRCVRGCLSRPSKPSVRPRKLRARGILEETLGALHMQSQRSVWRGRRIFHECAPGLSTFLSEFHSVRPDILSVSLYHHYDHEVVRHLFSKFPPAGLDSMLLGEAEILGQVAGSVSLRARARCDRPVLNRLFQGALEVGKRVRTETELGTRPMSVASAGVKLAERIFGKLSERKALVLGAGTISEQVVSQLRDRGIAQLHVMNARGTARTSWPSSSAKKGRRLGRVGCSAAIAGCGGVVGQRGRTGPAARIVERAMAARGIAHCS